MPMYNSVCPACGAVHTYLRTVGERHSTPVCHCATVTELRVLRAPATVIKNFDAFRSTVDGSIVSGDRSLREHNARNGVVPLQDVYSAEELRADTILARQSAAKATSVDDNMAADLYAAAQQVAAGYKPNVEVCDDD